METKPDAVRTYTTRDLNLAAYAMEGGAILRETEPAQRGLVRFHLELAEGQGEDLAVVFSGSRVARFMAIRDQLLDRVRAHGGNHGRREKRKTRKG